VLNKDHQEILNLIQHHAGKPTHHTFLDNYLGTSHPRYRINVPTLRKIAKSWMLEHHELSATSFSRLLTSLIKGESSTEKCMAGILLGYSTTAQRQFNPRLFNVWLDALEGWAEIDAICTNNYTITEILKQWKVWKPQLIQFSKSKNINKRRASIVLLCSPLRSVEDERLATIVFENIGRLAHEKDILITKAISWVLRSMDKHYKKTLTVYLNDNKEILPKIAMRETLIKLNTGTKTKRKLPHDNA
jgi:3-methyladenine DNA glycosylase AlkD